MLYVQLAAFPVLAVLGICLGRVLGRGKWWWVGVALALLWVAVLVVGHRSQRWAFAAPMSWAVDADAGPLVMTPVVAVLFTILMLKMQVRRTRVAIGTIMAAMLVYYGLLPAVLPLAARGSLLAGMTRWDKNKICLQTHAYTCGPAAAVTCLERLGVAAEEGPLAVEARCAPAFGMDGWVMAAAISRRYAGVRCTYRYVASVQELTVPAVVDIWSPAVGGHFVTVLQAEPDKVLVGDPISGQGWVGREEFLGEWRHGALVFTRDK